MGCQIVDKAHVERVHGHDHDCKVRKGECLEKDAKEARYPPASVVERYPAVERKLPTVNHLVFMDVVQAFVRKQILPQAEHVRRSRDDIGKDKEHLTDANVDPFGLLHHETRAELPSSLIVVLLIVEDVHHIQYLPPAPVPVQDLQ